VNPASERGMEDGGGAQSEQDWSLLGAVRPLHTALGAATSTAPKPQGSFTSLGSGES
jgi:hypothetical protein